MNLWQACNGAAHIQPIHGKLWRMVESQEHVATRRLVDDLDEQNMLEALLEQSKPAPKQPVKASLHYLLSTPFRYPPLKYGSRFGSRLEPSLFYAGLSEAVTLAEVAYYRLIFWRSMQAEPPKKSLVSQHSMFSARYRSARGIRLQHTPFAEHAEVLTHPSQYQTCQALGSAMRSEGIEAFEYTSARDHERGTCVALFVPAALTSRTPSDQSRWLCEAHADEVTFKREHGDKVWHFPLSTFMVDGVFPQPA